MIVAGPTMRLASATGMSSCPTMEAVGAACDREGRVVVHDEEGSAALAKGLDRASCGKHSPKLTSLVSKLDDRRAAFEHGFCDLHDRPAARRFRVDDDVQPSHAGGRVGTGSFHGLILPPGVAAVSPFLICPPGMVETDPAPGPFGKLRAGSSSERSSGRQILWG